MTLIQKKMKKKYKVRDVILINSIKNLYDEQNNNLNNKRSEHDIIIDNQMIIKFQV